MSPPAPRTAVRLQAGAVPQGRLAPPATALLLLALVAHAAGTTTTVTSLADSGPGTLRQAMLDANSGAVSTPHEIVVPAGTIVLASALPTLVVADVTLHGTVGHTALDASAVTGSFGWALRTDAAAVRTVIANLTITRPPYYGLLVAGANTTIQHVTVNMAGGDAIRLRGANIVVHSCTIETPGDEGIQTDTSAPGVLIDSCTITNGLSDGIYLASNNCNVTKTNVTSSANNGVVLAGTAGGSRVADSLVAFAANVGVYVSAPTAAVSGNVIHDSGNDGIYVHPTATDASITGNEIAAGEDFGIGVFAARVAIHSNTVHGSANDNIYIDDEAPDALVEANTLHAGRDVGLGVYGPRARVLNNTVSGSFNQNLYIHSSCTDATFADNSIFDGVQSGVGLYGARIAFANSTIAGNGDAGLICSGSGNTVSNLHINSNVRVGVEVRTSLNLSITDTSVLDNSGTGIVVGAAATNIRLTGLTVGNMPSGTGIVVSGADTVLSSSFIGLDASSSTPFPLNIGMTALSSARNLRISNTVFASATTSALEVYHQAIRLDHCTFGQADSPTFSNNRGLYLALGASAAIIGPQNRFVHNREAMLVSSTDVQVYDSAFEQTTAAAGLSIGSSALRTAVTNCIFANNTFEGLVVSGRNSTVTNCTASNNLGHGFRVTSVAPFTHLITTTAVRNRGGGILLEAENSTARAVTAHSNTAFQLQQTTLADTLVPPRVQVASATRLAGPLTLPAPGTATLHIFGFERCAGDSGEDWGPGVEVAAVPLSAPTSPSLDINVAYVMRPGYAALATAITFETFQTTSSMSSCVPLVNSTDACDLCRCRTTTNTVDCSDLGLLFVPENIPAGTTTLLLNGNNIFALPSSAFANLTSLSILDLSDNALTTDPSAALAPAQHTLLALSIARNSITTLDLFAASAYPQLAVFNASLNGLSDLRPDAFLSTSLVIIDLTNNILDSTIFTSARVASSPALTTLYLGYNAIESLPANIIASATSLTRLDLPSNRISNIDPRAFFSNASELRIIDLADQSGPASQLRAGNQLRGLANLEAVRWANAICPLGSRLSFYDIRLSFFICLPCPDGSYRTANESELHECLLCPAGTTDDDFDGTTACLACPAGTYAPEGSSGPCSSLDCSLTGSYDHDNNSSTPCLRRPKCSPGTEEVRNSKSGLLSCTECPPGFSDDDLSSQTPCVACGAGEYTASAATGACSTHYCDEGTLDTDGLASTPCQPCPPGTFVPDGSSGSSCSEFRCSAGTSDHDSDASTACVECFAGTYTAENTTGVCASHVCPSGWTDDDGNPATPCLHCRPGHYTPAGSSGDCDQYACDFGTIDHDTDPATPCRGVCGAGYFVERTAFGLCSKFRCANGTTDHDADPFTPCVACSAGTFAPGGSVGSCASLNCSAGTVDDDSDPTTPCTLCGAGVFVPRGQIGACDAFACQSGFVDSDNNPATPCLAIVVPPAGQVGTGSSNALLIGVGAGAGALLLLLLVILGVFKMRKNRESHKEREVIQDLRRRVLQTTRSLMPEGLDALSAKMKRLELPRNMLDLGEKLGEGEFGDVVKARLNSGEAVAVKQIKAGLEMEDQERFLVEAWLTASLQHSNVVGVRGVCSEQFPFLVALELLPGGNLRDYLRRCEPAQGRAAVVRRAGAGGETSGGSSSRIKVTQAELLAASVGLVSALAFLEEKNVVHRDLAARNVLVGQNVTQVKLADFGMSRAMEEKDYYRKTSDDKVPVKWMAPESIQEKVYSHKTDVWSFGVVLWEMFSFGAPPFAELTAVETALAVGTGKRMKRPDFCPKFVYRWMRKMWSAEPKTRPTFEEIWGGLEPRRASASASTSVSAIDDEQLLSGEAEGALPKASWLSTTSSSSGSKARDEASKSPPPPMDRMQSNLSMLSDQVPAFEEPADQSMVDVDWNTPGKLTLSLKRRTTGPTSRESQERIDAGGGGRPERDEAYGYIDEEEVGKAAVAAAGRSGAFAGSDWAASDSSDSGSEAGVQSGRETELEMLGSAADRFTSGTLPNKYVREKDLSLINETSFGAQTAAVEAAAFSKAVKQHEDALLEQRDLFANFEVDRARAETVLKHQPEGTFVLRRPDDGSAHGLLSDNGWESADDDSDGSHAGSDDDDERVGSGEDAYAADGSAPSSKCSALYGLSVRLADGRVQHHVVVFDRRRELYFLRLCNGQVLTALASDMVEKLIYRLIAQGRQTFPPPPGDSYLQIGGLEDVQEQEQTLAAPVELYLLRPATFVQDAANVSAAADYCDLEGGMAALDFTAARAWQPATVPSPSPQRKTF